MKLQRLALEWAVATFGEVANDRRERAQRFIEEAIELGQAAGLIREDVERIVARVYQSDPGDVFKEIGQVGMTLGAFAEVCGYDAQSAANVEFRRVQAIPKEEWERRHAAKVAVGIAS